MRVADDLPPGFVPSAPDDGSSFAFAVLGPEFNESDLAAWTSSIDYIKTRPGFGDGWPERAYTLAENEADLIEHADHHAAGIDYAWTILSPGTTEVIGCLYIKPSDDGPTAKWWLRADRAHQASDLDAVVLEWLATWPVPVSSVR